MDEDELVIGKKRRSSDPAVALAEEAVRMQHKVVVELRRKAAARIAKDEAAKKAHDKANTENGEQKNAPTNGNGKADAKKAERMVPSISNPNSTFVIEA